jgi:hypothetical protein
MSSERIGGAEVEENEDAERKKESGRRHKWRRVKRSGRQERGELVVREDLSICRRRYDESSLYFG